MPAALWGSASRGDRTKSEADYRDLLLRFANDSILLFDERFRVVDCNERALEMYGYARDELLSKTLFDLRAPEQAVPLEARLAEVRERGALVFESVNVRSDRSVFPVETSVRAVDRDGAAYFHAVVRDISGRKATEDELREALRRARQAARVARLGYWSLDVETGAFHPSEELLDIMGVDRGPEDVPAILGARVEELVHPDDRAERRSALDDVLNGVPRTFTWRAVRPDGQARFLEGVSEPVRDDDGKVVAAFGVTQDVTERVLAVEAIHESEKQYRALFENMLEGFAYCRMIYDEQGRRDDFVYLAVNPAFARLTGLHGAVGKRVTALIPTLKELNPELLDLYGAVAETGKPAEFDIDFAPLGRWLHVSATRPRPGEFVAFFYDITEQKQAHRRATENEAWLHRSLAAASAGIWEWDLVTGDNLWSEELWALYDLDEPHDAPSFDKWLHSIHPEDRDAAAAAVNAAAAQGAELNAEWRANTRDGSLRWLVSRGLPERDPDGRVVRYLGVVMDITETKQAEGALRESEARLRRLYESGLFGVMYWDMDGRVTMANDRFLEMCGYARAEMNAGALLRQNLIPAEYAELGRRVGEALRSKPAEVVRYEAAIRRKDGSQVPALFATATIDDGPGQVVTVALDISDRKRAEDDLHRLNLELEDRVGLRTAQLEAANKELEAFSYSVSHDLRAPLRHVSGFSELLAEHLAGQADDRTRHYLDTITRSAAEMGALIDDLLQFSRVARADMQYGRVDMDGLVRESLEGLSDSLGERTVESRVHELPPAFGDRGMLRQVWNNLVSNAFKYTRPRDPAVIEIGAIDAADETVYFVRDNGVGFDMAYADKLFHVFERLHRVEEYEGTGVGLANVERIVSRHGGHCWAEGAIDQGAEFYFALPKGGT